ncbi:hypothetical protein [Acetobacterium wieringae]|uniref:hypothetical protein n=1 Tax=Acetobacterium wieringae TaxID=52694 RepID=UPI002033A375|nr:hypothetical protein [Acetobacterium wieringae]URN83994.1 hypothetical protein CHL1_003162 [Acetobacterium wieringae]
MDSKLVEILLEKIETLEWAIKYKDEKLEEIESELADYKKAEALADGFGKGE